jgi:ribosomal protein S5
MAFEGKKSGRKGGRDNFKPKKEFKEELLAIDRVTRVTAGGRQLLWLLVMGKGE